MGPVALVLEVELKFAAAGPRPLTRLARQPSLGPAALGAVHDIDELDRYLDTPGGAFAAARWACRLRTRGGATIVSLKGPAEETGGGELHRRPELEGPATESLAPATWPPSEARDLVDRVRHGEPLVERLALRQLRSERPVMIEGRAVGTLTLDRVDALHHGESHGRFNVVELELHPGVDAAPLTELAAALRSIPGLDPEPGTKLERALALIHPAGQ